jgi:hypothetical protein
MRERATIAAVVFAFLALFGFLVFQAGVASNYQGKQQREPQKTEHASDHQKVTDHAAPSKFGVQIECDPNCAAQQAEQNANEGPIARVVRKTLDDPLTLFTAVLAFGTLFLALYTAVVARATRRAADHIPTVERAYLFIGPGEIGVRGHAFSPDGKDISGVKLAAWAFIQFSHFGPTPAFVKKIYWENSFAKPTSETPLYLQGQKWEPDLVLRQKKPFNLPKPIEFSSAQSQYLFGYVQYADIFRKEHTSRFCILIHPLLGKWEDAGLPPAWSAWD